MMLAPPTKLWTAEDLETLPDDGNRYEVIDGELLVTPAPSLDHQDAIAQLYLVLAPYVAAAGIGHAFFAPADVKFSSRRSVQPDLFVLPKSEGRRPRKFADVGHLLLSVEVISPSSARADRVKKRRVYREERVDEYWIVDLEARVFERSVPDRESVDIIADTLVWSPAGATTALTIDVPAYFARVFDE